MPAKAWHRGRNGHRQRRETLGADRQNPLPRRRRRDYRRLGVDGRRHRAQAGGSGVGPPGGNRRVVRKCHHLQGPRGHDPDLERGGGASLRLSGRGSLGQTDDAAALAGTGRGGRGNPLPPGSWPARGTPRNRAGGQGWKTDRRVRHGLADHGQDGRSAGRRRSSATSPSASRRKRRWPGNGPICGPSSTW